MLKIIKSAKQKALKGELQNQKRAREAAEQLQLDLFLRGIVNVDVEALMLPEIQKIVAGGSK